MAIVYKPLLKAMDKTKLVQRQVTVSGKNGTFTRMQWMTPEDAKKFDAKKHKGMEEAYSSKQDTSSVVREYGGNSGYHGTSRSVRSQEAIDSYEMPISMINRDVILSFLKQSDFEVEDTNFLKKVSVPKWKYVASKRVPASSWHHTGAYFKKTDHYSLIDIAEKILEIKGTLEDDFNFYKNRVSEAKAKEKIDIKYGVIKVQVWGGSVKRPKLIGHEEKAGIIIGDWFFYKEGHNLRGTISKHKVKANKVDWIKEYPTYEDLTKNHTEYKDSKEVFDSISKEKGA